MADGAVEIDLMKDARAQAYAMPLEDINVAQPELFQNNTFWPYFERLRKEAPVHYCREHEHGPYWSVTKYNDIMHVDTNHGIFSSEGGITAASRAAAATTPHCPLRRPIALHCGARGAHQRVHAHARDADACANAARTA